MKRLTDDDGTVEIAETAAEYGVELKGDASDDDMMINCEDETDARATAAMTGGRVVTRRAYLTGWAELR